MIEQHNGTHRLINRLTAALALLVLAIPFQRLASQTISGTDSESRTGESVGPHYLPLVGVPNFAEVTPELYRGGQPTVDGLQALAASGINIVIDTRGFDQREQAEVTRLGMQYIAIPWHCPFPKDNVFASFLAVLRDHPRRKIFVHCRLGDDRSGMMIASYRMAEEGWTSAQAMDEMKAGGFTFSHHLICPGLAHYEKEFPRHYATNPIFRTTP